MKSGFSPDTELLMSNGSHKMAKDVQVGDSIMGWDSTPRLVTEIGSGVGEMREIVSRRGGMDPKVISLNHPVVIFCTSFKIASKSIYDIRLQDHINGITEKRYMLRQPVDYDFHQTPLDPYIVGAWLGDGSASQITLTSADHEMISAWDDYWSGFPNLNRTINHGVGCSHISYWIDKKNRDSAGRMFNPYLRELKSYIINGEKRINSTYLLNSRDVRLQLLAGLIDTDGSKETSEGRYGYEYATIYDGLKDDFVKLSRSLGFRVSFKKKDNGLGFQRKGGLSKQIWNVRINGNHVDEIPCKIERKKKTTDHHKHKVQHCTYGFESESLGFGQWIGIKTHGDGRILLKDGIVIHDSNPIEEG